MPFLQYPANQNPSKQHKGQTAVEDHLLLLDQPQLQNEAWTFMMDKSSPSNYSESLLIKENSACTGENRLAKRLSIFHFNSSKLLRLSNSSPECKFFIPCLSFQLSASFHIKSVK